MQISNPASAGQVAVEAFKTANVNIFNDVTLSDDADINNLSLEVGTWRGRAIMRVTSVAARGFKWKWNLDSGVVASALGSIVAHGDTWIDAQMGEAFSTTEFQITTAILDSPWWIQQDFTFKVTDTAVITLQWAQAIIGGTATGLAINSNVRFEKMG